MKFLLTALNAKYIHSNPALYSLRAYARKHCAAYSGDVEIAEYTINQSVDDIAASLYEFDIDTDIKLLNEYCSKCDFVFHLAGVNRPKDEKEYLEGNFGFTSVLLDTLKKNKNTCPVMISSSTQAELDNPYVYTVDEETWNSFRNVTNYSSYYYVGKENFFETYEVEVDGNKILFDGKLYIYEDDKIYLLEEKDSMNRIHMILLEKIIEFLR